MANIKQERAIEARQLSTLLREIHATIYSDPRPLGGLHACVTGTGRDHEDPPASGWKPFPLHGRWGGFDQTTWFRAEGTVPEEFAGKTVVAFFEPGGESLLYVNGEARQGLDKNHNEVLLTNKAQPGRRFEFVMESVPSVRFDEYHHFERAEIAVKHMDVWDFYWDCRTVMDVLEQLDSESRTGQRLHELLMQTLNRVDLQHAGDAAYHDSVAAARRFLNRHLKAFEAGNDFGSLTVAGQSHIDTAWLWPLRETHRKCGRTFSTVLDLLDRYPDFVFICSQPVQYQWMREMYPGLYKRIKKYVKAGRWEAFGAMWVESDCNVPSGESFVRQLLYGNRFFRDEFGVQSHTAWLPDSFGYAWSLPQIFKKAQIDTFVTTKISWSRFTEFPYSMFQWEGADGSRILGLMPPLNYNGQMTIAQTIEQWDLFKQKRQVDEVPYAFGHGDGGGGPTMEMVERASRLGNTSGVPRCRFGRFQDCIDRMREQAGFETLPVWNDELYLEYHRGCQTTQARTKRHNRKCESALRDAEFLSSLALAHGGEYPAETFEEAWKYVLTNQFHDVLPGSSITEVYKDTERDYALAYDLAASALTGALGHIAGRLAATGEGTPVMLVNTLSWVRDAVVELPDSAMPDGPFHVLDAGGNTLAHQSCGDGSTLVLARDLPPMGYTVCRVVAGAAEMPGLPAMKVSEKGIENGCVRVRFNRQGRITSIFDKVEKREVVPKGEKANVLQLFDDRPGGNDAWDIEHTFENVTWEVPPAESIEVLESGPLRAAVRMVFKTDRSTITQDVVLHAGSSRIDFRTHVDWWEKRVLMKAAFPAGVRASRATYEIQYAAIERATHRNTPFDAARFEVPAQRWADLSEGDYGVSLLNESKYGYDVHGNVLRISLLRSPVEPDVHADEGAHDFTYALYPHGGDWRNGTVLEAAELNVPVLAVAVEPGNGNQPPAYSFAAVDAEHVLIDTVKKHEDSGALIVRCYEAYGQRGPVTLTFGKALRNASECDLMEENDEPVKVKGNALSFQIKPFELRTFKVRFK